MRVDIGGVRPPEARRLFREGKAQGPTAGWCRGYAQANLAVMPRKDAYDFLLFCVRNPKPCPVLDVTEAGSAEPRRAAPGADIRYDLSQYRVYRKGEFVEEPGDIAAYWGPDMVGFLLGCSFSFEDALLEAKIPMKHIEHGENVAIYNTTIQCEPAGRFSGTMVVSMRPIPGRLVPRAVTVTSRFPGVHGIPVHVGDPEAIGIKDVFKVDWGDPPRMEPGDVPVFWACGVTPQAVALNSKPDLMLTHSPGRMFITDILNESLSVL
ncbi:MAG: putative hydro-lyase [Bacillota bacterium]|jgi:uncharacterized protein YcsI (UPF0317 family)